MRALVVILGLALLSACTKTKQQELMDVLDDIVDINIATQDKFYSIVEDNLDICGKCIKDVRELIAKARSEMEALKAKYQALRREAPDAAHYAAVNDFHKDLEKAFRKMDEEANSKENYRLFEKFARNCQPQFGEIVKFANELPNLYAMVMGPEFA